MKYIKHFLIYFSSFYISSQLTVYFTFEFFCVDNNLDRIKYTGGEIEPNNPRDPFKLHDNNYVYYFPQLKHNLNESLCIYIFNYGGPAHFSFKKALLNEYDISEIEYRNFWECSNCNINSPNKYTINGKCNNMPLIYLSHVANYYIIYNDFCLKTNR